MIQALQLLGWCAGSPLEDMRLYLPPELLSALLEATDAAQAAVHLDAATISAVRSRLEPFLSANRSAVVPGVPESEQGDAVAEQPTLA